MSELKTNKISTNDQNNVALDNALGLKSYDTAGRDALTSVAGDMIYNTSDSKVQVYNGSAWEDTGLSYIPVNYLVIGGGGAGCGIYYLDQTGAGGGAGGYRCNYASENSGGGATSSDEFVSYFIQKSTSYTVAIGAGGTGNAYSYGNTRGNISEFSKIISLGGGAGGGYSYFGESGSSSGGRIVSASGGTYPQTFAVNNQGYLGGTGGGLHQASGGGGGAGSVGTNAGSSGGAGGAGGSGISSSITGSSVGRAGGGGGGGDGNTGGSASDGGGAGGNNAIGTAGTANTGGGGGGAGGSNTGTPGTKSGGNGGSGVVILRYPNSYTITLAGGATSTAGEQTDGDDKYIQIETSGTVSWA
jgi:hypothetical protein